jgi:hypothetical protein
MDSYGHEMTVRRYAKIASSIWTASERERKVKVGFADNISKYWPEMMSHVDTGGVLLRVGLMYIKLW